MMMNLTVERLAEVVGARVLQVTGIGHRRWGQITNGPLVIVVEPWLCEGQRADEVASALLEWWVWRYGWGVMEAACLWLRTAA